MSKKILLIILFVFTCSFSYSQSSAGYTGSIEPQYIIDKPNCGLIGKHNLGLNIDLFQEGGILLNFTFGVFNILDVGLSYGGYNIIGAADMQWNNLPGVKIKVRVFEEKVNIPAFAIGFESQGREKYISSSKRYLIKSPGFYVVASKNFKWFGFVSYHLGINYSIENEDKNKNFNAYLGIEKTLGDFVSFNAEYDFAFNDNNKNTGFGQGKGYLNAGLKWYVGNGVTVSLSGKNMLDNTKQMAKPYTRIIGLEIIQMF